MPTVQKLRTILTIRDGQCRFPVTAAPPHLFCGEVTALDRVYCDHHHTICNAGFGKDVGALELMMIKAELTVVRDTARNRGGRTQPVDVVIGGDK